MNKLFCLVEYMQISVMQLPKGSNTVHKNPQNYDLNSNIIVLIVKKRNILQTKQGVCNYCMTTCVHNT